MPVGGLAELYLRKLTYNQHSDLMTSLLATVFGQVRRARVRGIEEKATNKKQQAANRREELYLTKRNREVETDYKNCPWDAPHWSPLKKKWMRLLPGGKLTQRLALDKEFAAYYKSPAYRPLATPDLSDENYDDGFLGWKCNKALSDFREATKIEVTLELTEELLGCSFSIGSGREVSWGEATAENHFDRITCLINQAGGSIITAKRHKAAIGMLERCNANNLSEIKTRSQETHARDADRTSR